MANKSTCDKSTSSSGWTHGRKHNKSFKLNPLEIFSIVPAFMIEILTNEFNGRLSSVFFLFWHVEIINEDNTLFAYWWAIHSLSQFIQFSINSVLSLITACLRTENHANVLIILAELFGQQLIDIE